MGFQFFRKIDWDFSFFVKQNEILVLEWERTWQNTYAKCTYKYPKVVPPVVHIAQEHTAPIFIPKEEKTTGNNRQKIIFIPKKEK